MIGIVSSSRIVSIQKQFLFFALRNLGWRTDKYVLPSYEARLKLLNMETLEKRRKKNDILFTFDPIKKNLKCEELCSKIIWNQAPPQNLRRRRALHVNFHTRNYTYHEPISRISRTFNEVSHQFDNSISRRCFANKISNWIQYSIFIFPNLYILYFGF